MRISDWSSDVCSSDLGETRQSPTGWAPTGGGRRFPVGDHPVSDRIPSREPIGWVEHRAGGTDVQTWVFFALSLCVVCVLCGPKALRFPAPRFPPALNASPLDRKSTRLNSSH